MSRPTSPVAAERGGGLTVELAVLLGAGHPDRVLLDVSGRKVTDLVPGVNDVSGLAPGVYFAGTQDQVHRGRGRSVRKVVIQR